MTIKKIQTFVFLCSLQQPIFVLAAQANQVSSPTLSIVKMVLGLMVVLAVMAGVAWLAKKMVPGMGAQPSAIRIVGGVSVGSRERVVVLEVAGRWIVVGVASGQVNGIANVEPGAAIEASLDPKSGLMQTNSLQTALPLPPFAQWLKKSMTKFSEK